ncbi:hypothetical protein SAMN05428981_1011335 [Bacillus sp. OV194]|nr:hypothetical protein SAMN05428981_1011335 [Bacillus sp. OV194]
MVEVCLGYLLTFRRHNRPPILENHDLDDIKEYCARIEMLQGDINKVVEMWDDYKTEAVEFIRKS